MHTRVIDISFPMSMKPPFDLPNSSEAENLRLNTIHWGMRELWQSSVRVPIHHPAVRVLDVGCGSGIWVKELARVLPRSFVTGVDLSPVNIPEDPNHPLPSNMVFEVLDPKDVLTEY